MIYEMARRISKVFRLVAGYMGRDRLLKTSEVRQGVLSCVPLLEFWAVVCLYEIIRAFSERYSIYTSFLKSFRSWIFWDIHIRFFEWPVYILD